MVREVDSIPAQRMPAKFRANSVIPSRNFRENSVTTTFKHRLKKNLFADPSKNSIQHFAEASQDGELSEKSPPRQLETISPRDGLDSSFQIGRARFKTPGPLRHPLAIINDPLRYLN